LFYVIIPPLFLYFLPFCYPYILLHFKCFLLLVPLGDLGATCSSLVRILPLLALRRGDPISANDALELSGAVLE